MGCVSSKQAVSVTPAIEHSGENVTNSGRSGVGHADLRNGRPDASKKKKKKKKKKRRNSGAASELGLSGSELCESGRVSSRSESISLRLGNLSKYIEGEHVAAGWPAWLSAVAGEAIYGWVPLRADAFEKLEKIGQGTYSSVFRARDVDSGRIVALKKVRFENFEPESVRFMAREILILRKLDHPNIMKLDGIITSRLSCSIYLVFEYMEHDITGLLSCPEIKFTESQIKCYMKQLLAGLDHCHALGIMHRDMKGSNLLVNNEGILKVADFGLANFCSSGLKQPLTSRVVTLWYRPPELLLGSTNYGAAVDLWSVGCVCAELLVGKPALQGRTEVEQLHKIFKLCGSPPDDYWKKSRLPHATLFKPQHHYDSCLRERFADLPQAAVNLIETLLSVEPQKRGTASSALASEYFATEPYACDPSDLPAYPPNKEIDAKHREDAKRKKIGGRVRGGETRKPVRKQLGTSKLASIEDCSAKSQGDQRIHVNNILNCKQANDVSHDSLPNPSNDTAEEALHVKQSSLGDIPFSGPLQVSSSSGFAWARRRKDDASTRSHARSISKSHVHSFDSKRQGNGDITCSGRTNSRGNSSCEVSRHAIQKQWNQFENPRSFDDFDEYHSQELSVGHCQSGEIAGRKRNLEYNGESDKVEFSGPLLSQSHRVDELLAKHERQIRQAVRNSWFQKVRKNG